VAKPEHKPRTAIRGSVSTPIPPGWVSLDRVIVEAKIGKVALNDLRRRYRYIIPRPLVVPLATGRGGAAFYPPETSAIIRRLQELRREARDRDDCLWRLWLEGYSVDTRGWAAERLEAMANRLAEASAGMPGNELGDIAAALIAVLDGRVRSRERVADLVDWALSAGAGEPDALRSLEDTKGPPIFDTLRKAGGLPLTAAFPLPEAELIELLAPRRLAEIAAEATDEEIAQARRDYQTINRLSAAIAAVDWNAARPIIERAVATVIGAKTEPPSWQARKAKRTRAHPPLAIVKVLLGILRSYNSRAAVLAFLVGVRRLPGYSKHITDLLALTEWAISLFPRNSVAMP
jgi:hypothetical protein